MSTPPSSSTCSSASSPSAMDNDIKPELGLDDIAAFGENRTDTLEFLLQTLSNESTASLSSQENPSAEWSQMNWTTPDSKFTLGPDFDFQLPMDLDFQSNMAVDPSTLHLNPSMFSQQQGLAIAPEGTFGLPVGGQLEPASIFTFEAPQNSWLGTAPQRRLSITSSSSGASLSPVPEYSPIISSSASDSGFSEGDIASELAHRVRQLAGVTLAVPVSAQVQQLAAAGGQAKLPIPRLPRPNTVGVMKRVPVKPASSPEATSPPSSSGSPISGSPEPQTSDSTRSSNSPPPVLTSTGRPKTSHTTIERRYRTNLNARITGLKQAVPALRVLEQKSGNPYGDVVDSRGFVDGVKVARKMSKANVLGKATEYIRVLKRREARLIREQDGLKSLVSGLIGGPALLREWEREWRDKFGGAEKDELEENASGAASDDDDGDGEESDEEGEVGRAKKKPKLIKPPKEKPVRPPPPPPAPIVPGAVPEKRKRGRPRKNPLPSVAPVAAAIEQPGMVTSVSQGEGFDASLNQPGLVAQPAPQYLLAAFAFFSIFNSPLASSYSRGHSPPNSHHGIVITNQSMVQVPQPAPAFSFYGYSAHDIIQAFHLLVSTLVLFYVVLPWFFGMFQGGSVAAHTKRLASFFPRSWNILKVHGATATEPHPSDVIQTESNRTALMAALALSRRGQSDEAAQLRDTLGVSTGVIGLLQGVIKAARIDRGIELNQLEQRAWVRLGELVALDSTTPKATRLQTYWCMSWHLPTFSASTTDLSTLALIIRPVSGSKATELWNQASKRDTPRAHEKMVLSTITIDEAAELLEQWRVWRAAERKTPCASCERRTPLGILAAIITRIRLRKFAASMFVRTVVSQRHDDDEEAPYDSEKDRKEERDMRDTIEAAKSIGGRTAGLAVLLERTWETGFCPREEDVLTSPQWQCDSDDETCGEEHDLADLDAQEIRSLITATLIYRRIFPSSFPSVGPSVSLILSPPPSPSRKNVALHTALRTALGSAAFDYVEGRFNDPNLGGALEDARDRVVDMLVELERAGRRNGRY